MGEKGGDGGHWQRAGWTSEEKLEQQQDLLGKRRCGGQVQGRETHSCLQGDGIHSFGTANSKSKWRKESVEVRSKRWTAGQVLEGFEWKASFYSGEEIKVLKHRVQFTLKIDHTSVG